MLTTYGLRQRRRDGHCFGDGAVGGNHSCHGAARTFSQSHQALLDTHAMQYGTKYKQTNEQLTNMKQMPAHGVHLLHSLFTWQQQRPTQLQQ
jgi:hypothetical protein